MSPFTKSSQRVGRLQRVEAKDRRLQRVLSPPRDDGQQSDEAKALGSNGNVDWTPFRHIQREFLLEKHNGSTLAQTQRRYRGKYVIGESLKRMHVQDTCLHNLWSLLSLFSEPNPQVASFRRYCQKS